MGQTKETEQTKETKETKDTKKNNKIEEIIGRIGYRMTVMLSNKCVKQIQPIAISLPIQYLRTAYAIYYVSKIKIKKKKEKEKEEAKDEDEDEDEDEDSYLK